MRCGILLLRRVAAGAAARIFIATVVFIVLAVAAFAYNKDDNLNDILKKMEEAEKGIYTLKAEYTRSIFFESTKEKQEVSGTLFLRKPDSIYINQRASQEQHIYIDGKNITIYVPENRQAVIDSWKNFIDGDFALAVVINFGRSWREIKKTNIISFDGENEENVVIKVNLMENKDWNIKIYVSKATMYPGKAVIESDGVRVEIIFKSYTLNPALNKNMFKFNASGIEVIKLN
ncbi:MAG: outer-membrane lipoprotein carrier protein LolA [Endomicrobium sp.]|jgi:outer membrane lipoprotein-sorting protein|nr:outer-membrane lipoprotein carrier protein LolA [Endomicrobium sp.]